MKNLPHEKSPFDLSSSMIKSASTNSTTLENIILSFIRKSNEMCFDFYKSIREYLPLAQVGPKIFHWVHDFRFLPSFLC